MFLWWKPLTMNRRDQTENCPRWNVKNGRTWLYTTTRITFVNQFCFRSFSKTAICRWIRICGSRPFSIVNHFLMATYQGFSAMVFTVQFTYFISLWLCLCNTNCEPTEPRPCLRERGQRRRMGERLRGSGMTCGKKFELSRTFSEENPTFDLQKSHV